MMFVVITNPSSNEVEFQRELDDNELMDARHFADEWAHGMGVDIEDSSGYIPNCSGDIRVEFRPDPSNTVHIWSGESFYFKQEG